MDVVHQVLQVRIHARLRVDRLLLACNQVVELNDADCHGFVLLCLNHQLSQLYVPDQLNANNIVEVCRLGQVPPVLARQRRVYVISEAL